MQDPFQSDKPRKKGFKAIEIDAWFDSSVYAFFNMVSALWERFSDFMDRFRVYGMKRFFIEILDDGLTFILFGALFALTLAQLAFDETQENWRVQSHYSVTFMDHHGNEVGKRGILHDNAVPLDEIPDYLIKATLATEDRRFFHHFGIDIIGTLRAMYENARANSVVQGGSSITQQLAKNLFLSNERTLTRKVKEAFLSLWLEMNLSKREILKLYMDRAYLGGGTHGVAAAAKFYFDKNVQDISLAEAAMLSGLYKAPTKYAPHVNLPAARARAIEVLDNMVEAGFLTHGQTLAARHNPATPVDRSTENSPDYFLDWAFDEVKRLVPDDEHILVVRTTFDRNLQNAADTAIDFHLRQYGPRYRASQASMVAMEPDGAVRAIVGGRDYGESQFNRAVGALRQPGSAFKPFVYTAAMMNGYTPRSIVPDAPITIGGWSPRNYTGRYAGNVTLTRALVKSYNTVPVRLAQAIGRGKIIETAQKMGIKSKLKAIRSLPLGVAEVSVFELTSAYAPFANGGYKIEPYGITQIHNLHGKELYNRDKRQQIPQRILPESVVAAMNPILTQVVEIGTGRRAQLDNIPAAGKTGTTNSYIDAWFVGYTGNYVAGVWYGNDNNSPTARATGGSLPAMTWNQFMRYAHAGIDIKPIPYVDEKTLKIKRRPIVQSIANKDMFKGDKTLQPILSASSASIIDRIGDLFANAESPTIQSFNMGLPEPEQIEKKSSPENKKNGAKVAIRSNKNGYSNHHHLHPQ